MPQLADDWSFDQPSGPLTDTAGGYNATVTGSTKVTAGKTGDGLRFDGTASPVTDSAPSLLAPWTVGVWVRPAARSSDASILSDDHTAIKVQDCPAGPRGRRAPRCAGKVAISIAGQADYISSYAVPLNRWTYLTLVDDGTTTTVYANGRPVSVIKASIQLGRSVIGSPTPVSPYRGFLDELSVYSNALTPSQVAALYASAVSAARH